MSIFIDPDLLLPVSLKYKPILDSKNRILAVEIHPDDSTESGVEELVCDTTGRDFDTMSKLLESSTIINHITGKPMVRMAVFQRGIMLRFFKGWNVYDGHGAPIELNNTAISRLHDDIVRVLTRKWLKMTKGRDIVNG